MDNDSKPISILENVEVKERLNNVRKDIYYGGIKGFIYGVSTGSLTYYISYKYIPSMKKYCNKNNFTAMILITASIGSFIGSLVNGKNSLQYVGDIFKMNSNSKSNYMNQLNKNEQDIINSFEDSFTKREAAIKIANEKRSK